MRLIGVGNELHGDEGGRIVEDFGGLFIGPNLDSMDELMRDEDEVIVVDSAKSVRFLVLGLEEIYPGVLSYSELEEYLMRARMRGVKAKVTIVAFSRGHEGEARCFLTCLLSRRST